MAAEKKILSPQSKGRKPVYPTLEFDQIKNPSRFWATPIFGGLIKIVILIPVFIEIIFLILYIFIVSVINSFVVLLTGKYWRHCFNVITKTLHLTTKTGLFFVGLTNKYPGFTFDIEDKIKLSFEFPQKPSRFFAIPVLGGLARIILLLPFTIYTNVISNGAFFGAIVSSFPVFFKSRYPESTYEIGKDAMRLGLSEIMYFNGLSDSYPSFNISMNHQTIKIMLIIVGVLMLFNQTKTKNDRFKNEDFRNNFNNQYQRNYIPNERPYQQNTQPPQDNQLY